RHPGAAHARCDGGRRRGVAGMIFGRFAIAEAQGAVLAHSVRGGTARLAKGRRLTADDIAMLQAAGVTHVTAVREEPGDVGENEAAARIAAALRGEGFAMRPAATGRANLHAAQAGLFTVNAPLIHRLNAIDPAITLATLADSVAVRAGQMVATVKI